MDELLVLKLLVVELFWLLYFHHRIKSICMSVISQKLRAPPEFDFGGDRHLNLDLDG